MYAVLDVRDTSSSRPRITIAEKLTLIAMAARRPIPKNKT
jgi:hypothetical protein